MKKPFVQHCHNGRWFDDICDHVIADDPVHVYKNLTNKKNPCWSIRQHGIVVCHTPYICLRDCEFRVQPAGREKVRRTKHKGVHAYVYGYIIHPTESYKGMLPFTWDVATYNPYKFDTFVNAVDHSSIKFAKFCDMFTESSDELLVYLPV